MQAHRFKFILRRSSDMNSKQSERLIDGTELACLWTKDQSSVTKCSRALTAYATEVLSLEIYEGTACRRIG
ncbi:hypothetical protein DZC73_17210 [Albitalea terrae]|uniref:Uncharacterized protein n=1 Tax=Piscinibacter terrae TaxID=2496871 RepID=A0A3N7IYN6_9BURK|nr:hypothetical protein DZC73_17210 [Albitalea terrae]